MTDTQHSQEKEALEDAANRLLTYPGTGQVATLAYTETTDWITHDDGSVTGTNYGNGVKWSANALAPHADIAAARVRRSYACPGSQATGSVEGGTIRGQILGTFGRDDAISGHVRPNKINGFTWNT